MSNPNELMPSKYKMLDLETGPDLEEARKGCGPYPKFDPDKVPLGNAKKPETVELKIEAARISHDLPETEEAYYKAFADKHCKRVPEYSKICTVGVKDSESGMFSIMPIDMTEREMIAEAWEIISDATYKIIGHSIVEFDFRMLIKRSWILGVKIPYGAYNLKGGRIYTPGRIIDVADMWNLGEYKGDLMRNGRRWSLSYIAKRLGVESAREYEVTGATFHEYWNSEDPHDHITARDYLKDDLLETERVYLRLK